MKRTLLLLLALPLPLAAHAIDAGARRTAPKPKYFKSVKVGDNFYAPARLTVKPYTKVTWRWPSLASGGGDTHDVYFRKTPRGVRHYQSEAAAADYRYSRLLTKLGTYRIVCTFHEGEMRQTIVVKR